MTLLDDHKKIKIHHHHLIFDLPFLHEHEFRSPVNKDDVNQKAAHLAGFEW